MPPRRTGSLPANRLRAIRLAVFVTCLLPAVRLGYLAARDGLGPDPIRALALKTGWWTLSFLLLTLAVTPLRILSGRPWVGRLRRMLGLYAFFYAGLHVLTYAGLDQFFSWPDILADLTKRPYLTIGFAAFAMLLPLAITSTDGMVRRLGGKRWRHLHRLVYAVAIAGVVHFWWLVKRDVSEPLAFGLSLALLLGFRLAHAHLGRHSRRAAGIAAD